MTQSITNIVKGDLKNYNNFKIRIKQLKEERSMLHHRLMSIGGSGYDVLPGNHESDIPLQDTELIQKITNIDNEIEHYRQRMYGVEVFLDTCDEELSQAMRKIYLQGYSYESVARKVYLSPNALQNRINREIERNYL